MSDATSHRAAMLEYAPATIETADLVGDRIIARALLVEEIMAATGLSRAGAASRIQLASDLGTILRVEYGVYCRNRRYAP